MKLRVIMHGIKYKIEVDPEICNTKQSNTNI